MMHTLRHGDYWVSTLTAITVKMETAKPNVSKLANRHTANAFFFGLR
jgi:hypothetical protein